MDAPVGQGGEGWTQRSTALHTGRNYVCRSSRPWPRRQRSELPGAMHYRPRLPSAEQPTTPSRGPRTVSPRLWEVAGAGLVDSRMRCTSRAAWPARSSRPAQCRRRPASVRKRAEHGEEQLVARPAEPPRPPGEAGGPVEGGDHVDPTKGRPSGACTPREYVSTRLTRSDASGNSDLKCAPLGARFIGPYPRNPVGTAPATATWHLPARSLP